MTRAPASSRRATRHSGFTPSTDRSDRPAVLVPREGSPPPPGDVAHVRHARGCRIPPHPCDVSRGRSSVDGTRMTYGDIHQKSIDVARYEHFFGIHEARAGFSGV